jgi:putative ABC transport system ATP-binding protein
LQRLNAELGTTFVMVTHDPRAAAIATRKLRLEKGELQEEGAHEVALAAHA